MSTRFVDWTYSQGFTRLSQSDDSIRSSVVAGLYGINFGFDTSSHCRHYWKSFVVIMRMILCGLLDITQSECVLNLLLSLAIFFRILSKGTLNPCFGSEMVVIQISIIQQLRVSKWEVLWCTETSNLLLCVVSTFIGVYSLCGCAHSYYVTGCLIKVMKRWAPGNF